MASSVALAVAAATETVERVSSKTGSVANESKNSESSSGVTVSIGSRNTVVSNENGSVAVKSKTEKTLTTVSRTENNFVTDFQLAEVVTPV